MFYCLVELSKIKENKKGKCTNYYLKLCIKNSKI